MNITSGGFVLAEILEQVDSLPSPPGVAVEVLRLTADDSCCIDDLAQVIARDPVLAAKILKLSNSSLFRRGEDVTTLDRAMMVLGLKTVKLMALSFSLASSLPQASNSGSGFDLQAYWRASLTLAVAARALGVLTRSRNSDEAFLCGLLARIGQLALSEAMPERYRAVIEQSPDNLPDADLERRHLDFDHHDVGAALLESWGMPAMISQAIRLMGTSELPTELDQRSRQLGVVLELARHATTVLCESRKGPALHSLHELCREHHGLDEAEVDSFLIGLQGGIAETAQLLNIDALESIPHDRILEKARMQMVNISLGTALDLQQSSNRARELEQERDAFEEKAMTDKLTGIRNRAFFDETLRDVVVARRNGEYSGELGLLVVDIDHFKKFNDTHGHAVGDEVLKMVARGLEESTRKVDFCARYGGEEFVVIIPEASSEILERVAERQRQRIEQECLVHEGESLSVQISVGGACSADICGLPEAEALLREADACLYEAKRAGRNRSVCRSVERVVVTR